MEQKYQELRDRLLATILAGDRKTATGIIDAWAEDHAYHEAVTVILEPTLAAFGELWATQEDVSLGQGYVAGKVAEDTLERALAEQASEPVQRPTKGPVIIGNIEDDCHVLGRKLVSVFLRLAGWQVIDLGEDVLAKQFVDEAQKSEAPIIAASAMMYRTATNIERLRNEIDNRGLVNQVQLAVGGAVFLQRPELVEQVGGDGTARNAIEAPKLMDRLLERALAARDKPRQ